LITISISLVLGYPIAYWMSLIANRQRKQFFYLIISLPIWINLLIRTIGLEIIFTWFDVSIGQTIFIGTNLGVVTAMVWLFLPIIILPIYQSLTSVDKILIEVSQDLGASPLKTFWKITFRHSIHGIAAGSILMLPMIMGALTVPKYIGKGKISWIGNLIETYFLQNEDFTLIAVASICLSLVLLIISLIIKKTAKQIWNAKGIKDDKKIF
jgi:spermidine/putrescine transport system permease protein